MTILEPSSDSAPADVADAPATPAAPRPRPRGGKLLHLAERYALLLLLIVIVIFFSVTTVQTGDLDALTLSPDGQRLQFQFWATWNGHIGPFVFDLTRG